MYQVVNRLADERVVFKLRAVQVIGRTIGLHADVKRLAPPGSLNRGNVRLTGNTRGPGATETFIRGAPAKCGLRLR